MQFTWKLNINQTLQLPITNSFVSTCLFLSYTGSQFTWKLNISQTLQLPITNSFVSTCLFLSYTESQATRLRPRSHATKGHSKGHIPKATRRWHSWPGLLLRCALRELAPLLQPSIIGLRTMLAQDSKGHMGSTLPPYQERQ